MSWTENNVTSLKFVIVGIVVVLLGLLTTLSVMTVASTYQEGARLKACTTITNQQMRRDCIAGPDWQKAYATSESK